MSMIINTKVNQGLEERRDNFGIVGVPESSPVTSENKEVLQKICLVMFREFFFQKGIVE